MRHWSNKTPKQIIYMCILYTHYWILNLPAYRCFLQLHSKVKLLLLLFISITRFFLLETAILEPSNLLCLHIAVYINDIYFFNLLFMKIFTYNQNFFKGRKRNSDKNGEKFLRVISLIIGTLHLKQSLSRGSQLDITTQCRF